MDSNSTVAAAPSPAPLQTNSQRPQRSANWFWLGFALGFALLVLASCGGLVAMLGLTNLRLADFQGNRQAWAPPTPAPTVEEVVSASALSNANRLFQAGDIVHNITSTRVNIRLSPGHLGKPAGDILAQANPGDTLEILGDSATQDNLTWWRVRFQGIEGWVAEATASGVKILAKP